jgi:hypothetical protein
MARPHSSTGSLQVCGIVALTLSLGLFMLGASAVAVVVFALLSASLVSVARARARGWSSDRIGFTATLLFGGLLLVLVGWGVARLVGVLVVAFGAWFVWLVVLRHRVRQL